MKARNKPNSCNKEQAVLGNVFFREIYSSFVIGLKRFLIINNVTYI